LCPWEARRQLCIKALQCGTLALLHAASDSKFFAGADSRWWQVQKMPNPSHQAFHPSTGQSYLADRTQTGCNTVKSSFLLLLLPLQLLAGWPCASTPGYHGHRGYDVDACAWNSSRRGLRTPGMGTAVDGNPIVFMPGPSKCSFLLYALLLLIYTLFFSAMSARRPIRQITLVPTSALMPVAYLHPTRLSTCLASKRNSSGHPNCPGSLGIMGTSKNNSFR